MKTAIWWIRRDLRLADNLALAAAHAQAGQVIPLFILDPVLLQSEFVGSKRIAFLYEGLRCLDRDLRRRGSYLVLRRGDPLSELSRLLEEHQVESIFAEMDFSPYARQRDRLISQVLPLEWVSGPLIHPPSSITRSDGKPYTVFTPFLKAWKAAPVLSPGGQAAEIRVIQTPAGISSLSVPDTPSLPASVPVLPGEAAAAARLRSFMDGIDPQEKFAAPIYRYSHARDFPAQDGTSLLSPYLRFGMLSIRQVHSAVAQAIQAAPDAAARSSAETWLNELVWREFYYHILEQFPQVRKGNFRLKDIGWQNDERVFAAWCEGQTGYPIVDAAMRQLKQAGWMHNRLRMVVASFLTKDLLVDWRWGEKFFMQHLIDGDPASNNGGWQWTAGTGTDAAPYFRIFNPTSQSKRFDPDGTYIRLWLPELAMLPAETIHEPASLPTDRQAQLGCIIGKDYPAPLIDHRVARARALQAFRQA